MAFDPWPAQFKRSENASENQKSEIQQRVRGTTWSSTWKSSRSYFVSVVWSLRHEICSRLDLEEGRTDCSTSWLTEGMRYHADWGDSEACQGTDGEDGEINKEEGS